jgi:hypothetical protein
MRLFKMADKDEDIVGEGEGGEGLILSFEEINFEEILSVVVSTTIDGDADDDGALVTGVAVVVVVLTAALSEASLLFVKSARSNLAFSSIVSKACRMTCSPILDCLVNSPQSGGVVLAVFLTSHATPAGTLLLLLLLAASYSL